MRTLAPRLALIAVALGLLAPGCSPVRQTWQRADYDQQDRTKVLRISVVVAPAPADDRPTGQLWAALARTYINQNRDFLVVEDYTAPYLPPDVCTGDLEGYLHLIPSLVSHGTHAEAEVWATLHRCTDHAPIWTAEAGGTWPTQDSDLVEAMAHWTRRLAPEATPHFVPSYRLLTGTLSQLPLPAFPNESYLREKIQLGE